MMKNEDLWTVRRMLQNTRTSVNGYCNNFATDRKLADMYAEQATSQLELLYEFLKSKFEGGE